MMRLFHALVWILIGGLFMTTPARAEIPYATDAPKPLSPAESIASFHLPDDLRIEIVASEPLIAEPGAMAFDEFGHLYVGELHGYNLEGYYDIQALNETGELDREVRRVHVEGPVLERARNEAVGVINQLSDTDGDGHFETGRVWATDLPPCYGLIRAREGLIAVCPPKIFYLADRDGDGRAEHREVLFDGFAYTLLERGINSPRRGADNWIYIAAGGGGGEITGAHLAEPVRIGHTDFRIQDDGSAIEAVTGTCATFGLALTGTGDRFIASTNRHALHAIPLEYRHLRRNPHVSTPGGNVDTAGYDRIYPTSEPDPWRLARNSDPAWVKFYGQRETAPNGYFTSACGPLIYRGGALPPAYLGNHFACDPANNLVTRGLLERDGATYRVTRAPGEEESEFLSSPDRWFRPINLEMGPDGALYIIDFYREIIEDYSAIPRHLQQRYVESLIAGYQHGRIWRVTAKDAPPFANTILGKATPKDLVAALESPNPWDRETAQRRLIARDASESIPLLHELFTNSSAADARLHAMYTLEAQGALLPEEIALALSDSSHLLRLRLAESWLDKSDAVREHALALAADPDPAVRLQAVQSLGESTHPEIVGALVSAAITFGDERWMAPAIVSSSVNRPMAMLAGLLQALEGNPAMGDIVNGLATTIAARDGGAEIESLLELTAATEGADPMQIAVLEGLSTGLERNRARAAAPDAPYTGLLSMLASDEPAVREGAVNVAGLLQLGDSPVMQRAWETAQASALDPDLPAETRTASANLLVTAPWARKVPLARLLDPREPLEVQEVAVRVLATTDSPELSGALLARFDAMSPRVQKAILEALFAREERLEAVLDGIEGGQIVRGTIPPIRRLQLLENSVKTIRTRAANVLGPQDGSERADVIKRFQPALAMSRDGNRGQVLFAERCSICHVLNGVGQAVGPDLSAVRTRPDEALLVDMLDPSGTITAGFNAYLVETEDGGFFTGMLAEETATSIVLRRARGETDTILRTQIAEMRTSPLSLMPDGLEEGLMPQDVADLLGYLRDTTGTPASASIIAFDEEPEMADALPQGAGLITFTTEDAHSGSGSLRVTPPQRYSPRIAGWQYRIVENPTLGANGTVEEIRYLRLAWKAEGKGVMLELADDGHWPAAEMAARRYYSGTNTTDWQGTVVAHDPPTEWTVITVDLWQDCGEFTLTGIAPTAMGGPAFFDRIELLASLDGLEEGVN